MTYFGRYLEVSPFSHAMWRALEATAMSEVELASPVLDLGCGFGEFAGVFCEDTIEVGVDISESEITAAAQKEKHGRLLVADARHLPFDDESFASVISVSVMEHIEDTGAVFPEVYRVLKPGGVFAFTVQTSDINDTLAVPRFLNRIGLGFLARAYIRMFHTAFKHVSLVPPDEWTGYALAAGLEVERMEGTISKRQVMFYELGLPTAMLTQISKALFDRRLPFASARRERFCIQLAQGPLRLFEDSHKTLANVFVISRKPLQG